MDQVGPREGVMEVEMIGLEDSDPISNLVWKGILILYITRGSNDARLPVWGS